VAVAYASAMAMAMVFGAEGGALCLVIVFDGVEGQGGVDVGVLRVAGRVSESTTVCVEVGRHRLIYETRAEALSILLRYYLVCSLLDVLSWNDEPLVSALRGDASLTVQEPWTRDLRENLIDNIRPLTSVVLPPAAVVTKSCTSRDR